MGESTLRVHKWIILFLLSIFVILWQAPPLHAYAKIESYLPLHTLLESISIVISFMVFGIAWNAWSHERAGNVVIIACAFFAVGTIDFLHIFSYKGMPIFVTPGDPEKAIFFWLVARFIAAIGLLATALRQWMPPISNKVRWSLFFGAIVISLITTWIGLFHLDDLPHTFIEGKGLTPLKIAAEYILILLFLTSAVLFYHQSQELHNHDAPSLFAATAIAVLSELCFTLYSNVADTFNIMGHVFKVIAYFFIYRALFIGSLQEPFQRMQRAEEHFRSLFMQARDGIALINAESGLIFSCNPEFERQTGRTINQLRHLHIWDIRPGELVAKTRQAFIQAREENTRSLDLDLLRQDGTRLTVEVSDSPIIVENHRIIQSICRDVSEREAARRALAESEKKYRTLFEESFDGLFIASSDGEIIDINRKGMEILGYQDISEVEGLKLADDIYATRDEATRIATLLSELERTEYDVNIKQKNGNIIVAHCAMSAVKNDEGITTAYRGIIRDVTERRRATEALKRSQQNLAEAQQIAHLGSWELDVYMSKFSWSDEMHRIFEITPENFDSSYEMFLNTIHPEDRETVSQAYSNHLHKGIPFNIVHRLLFVDGRTKYVKERCETIYDKSGQPLRSVGTVEDITNQVATEKTLRRLNRALRTLSEGNQVLVRAGDEKTLLREMCRVITRIGGYRMAWVGYAQKDIEKTILPVSQNGFDKGYPETTSLSWGDDDQYLCPAGMAIRTNELQYIPDVKSNIQFEAWRKEAMACGFASELAFPLCGEGGDCFGALTIDASEPGAFDQEEIKLLQELSIDLAYGIVNQRTREVAKQDERMVRKSLKATVEAIAATVEMRDPYTAGHEKRVANLAAAIARELGLSSSMIEGIQFGGSLHDLGKINIPAEILSKPGSLNTAEFELIKFHPQAGYDILKGIQFPWPIPQMVLQHHERIDGSGYPNSLKGDNIIIEARILAVADVVESTASHRPYRPALGIDEALNEIQNKSGMLYDPNVVAACVCLFRERQFTL